MEDEIVMNDRELRRIVVPNFKPPQSLQEIESVDGLKIEGRVSLELSQIKAILFNGINGHSIGQNKMMSIISVDDITSGRESYDDIIVKVRMKMGDLLTVLSVELSKDQIEEILKIGLRCQFGSNIESVRVVSFYHSLKKYDLEVVFKERCGYED